MKKRIFLLLMVGIILSSCSGDSKSATSNDVSLPLTLANINGEWNIKEFILADGTKHAYVNLCSSTKDYIKFYTYYHMEFYTHHNACNPYLAETCTNFYFLDNEVISNCNDLIDGTVTKLTAHEMQIEYSESRTTIYMGALSSTPIKGIVLIR